jgi:hypothetical protein
MTPSGIEPATFRIAGDFPWGKADFAQNWELSLAPKLRMSEVVTPCLLYLHGIPRDGNDLAESASPIVYSFCVLACGVSVFVLT